MIRPATSADSPVICEIYNHYVLNSVITFEERPVDPAEMERRIADIGKKYPWLVWEDNGRVAGYAYASQWKVRSAYLHTVESSIYLDPECTGRGIGKPLYAALMTELSKSDIHAVIGGVALPNDVSIKLHESLGFIKIGQFQEVGWKFGRWVDVGYWELLLGS